MKFIWTEVGMKTFFNPGASATISASTLHLFSNNVGFDWNRVIADLIDASYTGYTPISLATGIVGPFQDAVQQNIFVKLPMKSFGVCTAAPETEYGVYLSDTATGTIVYGMAVFDDPQFVDVGDNIFVNMLFPAGQGNQLSGVELDAAA